MNLCTYNHISRCFFFSSRRRHTRLQGDWSSDVCSSDLKRGSAIAPCAGIVPATLPRSGNRMSHDPSSATEPHQPPGPEIGRASCRERVQMLVVGEALKKKRD